MPGGHQAALRMIDVTRFISPSVKETILFLPKPAKPFRASLFENA
jgi:hypothetical protein